MRRRTITMTVQARVDGILFRVGDKTLKASMGVYVGRSPFPKMFDFFPTEMLYTFIRCGTKFKHVSRALYISRMREHFSRSWQGDVNRYPFSGSGACNRTIAASPVACCNCFHHLEDRRTRYWCSDAAMTNEKCTSQHSRTCVHWSRDERSSSDGQTDRVFSIGATPLSLSAASNTLMLACLLFREPNKSAKLKDANINCRQKIGWNLLQYFELYSFNSPK